MQNERKKLVWLRKLGQSTLSVLSVRKQAQLDYFLINGSCSEYVMDTNINPGYRTDHSSILFKLKFINNERGHGCWKFNNYLLKNKDFIKLVKDTIQEVIATYKTNDEQAINNI